MNNAAIDKPALATPPWTYFGWLFIFAGIIAIIVGLNMKTSMETAGAYGMPSEIVNIGFLQNQVLTIHSGMLGIIVGTLLLVVGALLKFSPVWQRHEASRAPVDRFSPVPAVSPTVSTE